MGDNNRAGHQVHATLVKDNSQLMEVLFSLLMSIIHAISISFISRINV